MALQKIPIGVRFPLSEGVKLINDAIEAAEKSETNSTDAVLRAHEAKNLSQGAETKATSVQTQLNTLIIESGTSDAETLQARTDFLGNVFDTIKERTDKGQHFAFRYKEGTPGSTEGLEAINIILGFKGNDVAPGIRGADVGQGSQNNENVVGAVLDTIGQPLPNAIDPNSQSAHYAFVRGYDNGVNGLADVVIAYHVKAHEAATHGTVVGGSYHELIDGDYSGMFGGTKNLINILNGGGYGFIGPANDSKLYGKYGVIISGQSGRVGLPGDMLKGESSFLGTGKLNTIDGRYAYIISGDECKATKDYSSANGKGAVANNVGESAFSTGKHKTAGDTLQSRMHLFRQTTTGIHTQLLLDDNNSVIQALGINTGITYIAHIQGYRVDAPGSASFTIEVTIERRTEAAVIKSITVTPRHKSDPLYDADAIISNNACQFRVKGVTGHTINWSGSLFTIVSRDI